MRVKAKQSAPVPLPASSTDMCSKSDISIYTTANALRALVNGQMRWQEAVDRGLVVLGGPTQQKEQVGTFLSSTLSGSGLAN